MYPSLVLDQHPADKNLGTTVLIVDDELIGQKVMSSACDAIRESRQLTVLVAATLDEAFTILCRQPVHVLLLDKNIGPIASSNPKHNGIDAIPEILGLQPHIQILVITASDDTQDTVEAIKYGAFGYICKGRQNTRSLMMCQIEKAITVAQLMLERLHAERGQKKQSPIDMDYKSAAMREVMNRVRAFAETSRAILFTGPSGAGKTALAYAVHECRRKHLKEESRPFVQMNIAALSANLVDSELFGYEKGAFTDAKDRKIGLIELANRGTLFLDEIGDASADVQVKLLKVLDEKVLRRVGGKVEIKVNFTLICATLHDLEKLVKAGTFREDLYMRISAFTVDIPALSERKEDIPNIIRVALPRWCEDLSVQVSYDELPDDLVEYLMNLPLPGNIRTLEHELIHVLATSNRDIHGRPILKNWRSHLRKQHRSVPQQNRGGITMEEVDKRGFDVVGAGFPGRSKFMEKVSDGLFKDARTKCKTNNAIARSLDISNGFASINLRRIHSKEAY